MKKTALLTSAIALIPAPSSPMGWYDYKCCNEQDCRQTVLGEVERHSDGWYVTPLEITVPFDDPRVRRSLDPLIHICIVKQVTGAEQEKLRCLYVPEVAG